jgi:hypothetical protein
LVPSNSACRKAGRRQVFSGREAQEKDHFVNRDTKFSSDPKILAQVPRGQEKRCSEASLWPDQTINHEGVFSALINQVVRMRRKKAKHVAADMIRTFIDTVLKASLLMKTVKKYRYKGIGIYFANLK